MPLNVEAIRALKLPAREYIATDRDCMLYALSIGIGRDPMNEAELAYVFEKDLKVFPTMAVVLGHPGPWIDDPRMGITRQMLVHATQRLQIHRPLQAGRPFVATNAVTDIVDKGEKAGAIVVTRRELHDKESGELLAVMESSSFCRADGGFGGPRELSHEFQTVPERLADLESELPTDENQALYYRLNGDRNPLHAEPAFAARAGFARPILHGLCTFAIAARALQEAGGPLRSIEARFSKPVFPGETIRMEMWRLTGEEGEHGGMAFRAHVDARNAMVLDRGRATFF